MRSFSIQLKDALTGKTIQASGGKCYVAQNGSPRKQALVDSAGAALANPVSLTRGHITFNVADETVTTVDLYIQAPGGQFVVAKDVVASGQNEIAVDTGRLDHTMVIPFAIEDTAAATETLTGFTVPGLVLPSPMVKTTTLDATEDVSVGTNSNDSGDADGFIKNASVNAAATVKASLANGAVTLGALLQVQDSANAGDAVPEGNVSMIGKEISYTLSAGSDTARGFAYLPVRLAA
jgi:hypothetical protein